MTVKKSRGRPKGFDRDDAVACAVEVFWANGYEGASVKMLTEAIGINSPSLYAEFGDKAGLYLQAIERYANNDACEPLVALEQTDDIEDAVRAFLHAVVAYSTSHSSGATGCFLASCVTTSVGNVAGTAELLHEAIDRTDQRIQARFDQEITRGSLPPDFPSRSRARILFDLRQGLVFRARAGVAESELVEGIDAGVIAVLGPTVAKLERTKGPTGSTRQCGKGVAPPELG